MCLILFAHDCHPDYRLLLAANRDEFYDRPTAPAGFWDDAPDVLAGRDLVGGGTWMGITRAGRLAALSNYRDPADRGAGRKSRGLLVGEYLKGKEQPRDFLEGVKEENERFPGFNLLVGVPGELWFYGTREDRIRQLSRGIYGLSNHLLDTPWPKVVRGRAALARLVRDEAQPTSERLLALLADDTQAPDVALPHTGVGLDLERILSPAFIASPEYGTRSSTALMIGRGGRTTFVERTFVGNGTKEDRRYGFTLET